MSNKHGMTIALGIMLSLTAFLSKTWFEGVNANAAEIQKMKADQYQIWANVATHGALLDERLATIKTKLEEIAAKLDKLHCNEK